MEYETREYKGYTIKIESVDYPPNPREDWDNLGHMVCWHRRYDLGDKHNFDSPEDFQEYIKNNKCVVLPLFLYDHSGITMSTRSFSCPWDSGQVGYIYLTYKEIRKEMARPKNKNGQLNPDLKTIKHITKKDIERAKALLESEVKVYDSYLRGEVFGWVISNEIEDHIDSCWGYYGTGEIEHMVSEAKNAIDYDIKKFTEDKAKEKFKNEIKIIRRERQ